MLETNLHKILFGPGPILQKCAQLENKRKRWLSRTNSDHLLFRPTNFEVYASCTFCVNKTQSQNGKYNCFNVRLKKSCVSNACKISETYHTMKIPLVATEIKDMLFFVEFEQEILCTVLNVFMYYLKEKKNHWLYFIRISSIWRQGSENRKYGNEVWSTVIYLTFEVPLQCLMFLLGPHKWILKSKMQSLCSLWTTVSVRQKNHRIIWKADTSQAVCMTW